MGTCRDLIVEVGIVEVGIVAADYQMQELYFFAKEACSDILSWTVEHNEDEHCILP